MRVGGQRHAPAALPQRKLSRYPLYRRLGGFQGWFGPVRQITPPPGFDLRTVQAVASRCNDWVNSRETDAPSSPFGSIRSTHFCGLQPFAPPLQVPNLPLHTLIMTICSSRCLAAHRTAEISTAAIWPTSTICYIRCAIFTLGCSNCIQKLQ